MKKNKGKVEGAEPSLYNVEDEIAKKDHHGLIRLKNKRKESEPCSRAEVFEPNVEATYAAEKVLNATSTNTLDTTQVEDSAKFTFNQPVVYVGVDEWKSTVAMEGLNQACVVKSREKFLVLFAILKRMIRLSKKVVIFFSTRNSVRYHLELLRCLKFNCYGIHGNSKWHQRTKAISSFSSANQNLLLCTHVGNKLDIPYVDFIIQYDPPMDPKEYVRLLQVPKGQAEAKNLLIVLHEQESFINHLRIANVLMKHWKFTGTPQMQFKLDHLVRNTYNMRQLAELAYDSYLAAYKSHSVKTFFKIDDLNLQEVASAFCLGSPPK